MDWKNLMNEGGEGWTPGRNLDDAPAPSRADRMDRLLHRMEGISSADPRMAVLPGEYNLLFESGRKADLKAEEKRAGHTLADMKRAIDYYGLK